MGLLFETKPENVLVHLENIYAENALAESTTANEFLAVQTEGWRLRRSSLRGQVKGDDESRIRVGQRRGRISKAGPLAIYTRNEHLRACNTEPFAESFETWAREFSPQKDLPPERLTSFFRSFLHSGNTHL